MNNFNTPQFAQTPVIGILRNFDKEEIELVARAFRETGMSSLEITINSADAYQQIEFFAAKYPDLNIGAGTVCTGQQFDRAVDAGASFIVCPICNIDLIEKAKSLGVPIFPGALTPTEIYQAWEAGATAVKIFPASAFGPSYVKEILAPLKEIRLLPTGGVNADNMELYFQAGAAGVGMGSALVGKRPLSSDGYEALLKSMQRIKSILDRATKVGQD